MIDYYDLVLGLIPLTIAGIAGTLVAVGVDSALAVPVGASLTVPLIGHAMFVRSPGRSADPDQRTPNERTGMNPAD